MKAALVRELPATEVAVEEVADPAPHGDDELVVEVEACGICGTDMHILAGSSYRPRLPFVLGHEVVVAADGRRAAVFLFAGCGECELCRAGDERLCRRLRGITGVVDAWGGFAERLLVRAAQLVPVPDGLSTIDAAALVDAGMTAANAARVARAHGGTRVAIAGGGPVGFLVAELLRLDGLEPLVVEPLDRRRAAAARAGHRVAAALAEVSEEVDAVVDCAAAAEVVPWALERLAPHGLFLAVGYTKLPGLDVAPLARKELTARGIRAGTRADLERILDLAARGEIRLPPVRTWPLAEINEAFAALRRGEVEGKAVIVVAGASVGNPIVSTVRARGVAPRAAPREGARWTS